MRQTNLVPRAFSSFFSAWVLPESRFPREKKLGKALGTRLAANRKPQTANFKNFEGNFHTFSTANLHAINSYFNFNVQCSPKFKQLTVKVKIRFKVCHLQLAVLPYWSILRSLIAGRSYHYSKHLLVARAVARALIGGGGAVVFTLISKEISRAEHEYMNIPPPPLRN